MGGSVGLTWLGFFFLLLSKIGTCPPPRVIIEASKGKRKREGEEVNDVFALSLGSKRSISRILNSLPGSHLTSPHSTCTQLCASARLGKKSGQLEK